MKTALFIFVLSVAGAVVVAYLTAPVFAVVRRTVEQDLGRPLAEVFTSFDCTPIASATSCRSRCPSATARKSCASCAAT